MVYINEETQGAAVSALLTKKQIQVNNLTVSTDGQGISIETNGEWTGDPLELFELIMEVLDAN